MKKLFTAALSLMMSLSLLAACSSSPAQSGGTSAYGSASTGSETKTFKVAIVQQMDHASLDEIRSAIEAELTARSNDQYTFTFESFSGQNDATVLNQIGSQVVSGGYDAIIPIATLAAQCMANATEGTDIPVVYAAISDPAAAGLEDIDNVTGTSDALNTPFILDMMLTANPDVKTVGLLYSNSEPNSATPIADAKAYLESKGIAYVEKTGNTTDEILSAANALVGQVDAVFTPTDNVVMGAAGAVAEILNEAGIPHYTGADSFVKAGSFATCGVNYTELGAYTADMAADILEGGEIPAYHVMDGGIITVNREAAEKVGIAANVFSSMAGQVVEVETEQ
ncbi:MAG: ABC transporter substrate-binding protein [Clostridiales bacterium]|nr:ABC transporter substrate-binding protein [Clostridiales bacterium]